MFWPCVSAGGDTVTRVSGPRCSVLNLLAGAYSPLE